MRKKIVYIGMYDYCSSGLLVSKSNSGRAENGWMQIKKFIGNKWGIERWGAGAHSGMEQTIDGKYVVK